MNKPTFIVSSIIIAVLAIGGFVLYLFLRSTSHTNQSGGNDMSIVDTATLNSLPKKSASTAYLNRLANGVIPPTNSWISGLALQEKPLAVYPMPLSFQALDTGFQIGLPKVTSDSKTIIGAHTDDIDVQIQSATNFQLSRFDKVSATLLYKQQNSDLGKLTLAQGSPYVFYRAIHDSTLKIGNTTDGVMKDNTYTYKKDGRSFIIAAHDSTKLAVNGAEVTATIPSKSLVTFYALPDGANDNLAQTSGNELTSVSVTNETQGNNSITKFNYTTDNDQPTMLSVLPYESSDGGSTVAVKYQSIYGDMVTRKGNQFSTTVPLITASNELRLNKLSNDEAQQVINNLKKDSQNVSISDQDSYYAGKKLARIATLLDISEQLNQKDISTSLIQTLKKELTARLGSNYFYYDTGIKGVAAQTAAFGSEDFNDHHFHYGYFIYAASILGKYDSGFVDTYKNEVNLLVADIASYETYKAFPVERNYDPYSGHSWAAGLSPFQDGNNQESSSEAVNAWNGVTLWAGLIKNKTLQQAGQWMLSNEMATAAKAWRNVDTSESYLSNYKNPVASLNFGGKRTYGTFFSDESNAKLGIQLLPMSPVMETVKSDDIKAKLAAQDKPNDYNVALGDYLIMYLALTDKASAQSALNKQSDEFIDDGNSRTYIQAWIYSH